LVSVASNEDVARCYLHAISYLGSENRQLPEPLDEVVTPVGAAPFVLLLIAIFLALAILTTMMVSCETSPLASAAPKSLKDGVALVFGKDKAKGTGLAQLLAPIAVFHGQLPQGALDDAPPLVPKRFGVHVALDLPPRKHLQRAGCHFWSLAKNSHRLLVRREASQVVESVRGHRTIVAHEVGPGAKISW
jgi:hypothetical protein